MTVRLPLHRPSASLRSSQNPVPFDFGIRLAGLSQGPMGIVDKTVLKIAAALIAHYGVAALEEAERRATKSLEADDPVQHEMWRLVAQAVRERGRTLH
jgi:hypothetical protein